MAAEWLTQVPEDIRGEAMLQSIPDVPTLAKNYVNAQRLVGTDRIQAPQSSWGDKEWGEFFNKAGRPETPDKYTLPTDLKMEEGVTLDEKKLGAARAHFHKMGLTNKQADGMLRYYAESLNSTTAEQRQKEEASVAENTNKLRAELGDKFEEGVDLAKGVLRQFGSPDLINFLNESRLGDNPHLIRALMNVGKAISEDSAREGGRSLLIKDATQAKLEVDRLSVDKEFQDALQNRENPAHRQALERWEHAFRKAYPGTQGE
jgi:hypothetical protein